VNCASIPIIFINLLISLVFNGLTFSDEFMGEIFGLQKIFLVRANERYGAKMRF